MLMWDDRPVSANAFKTYIEFTSIGIFARASWLRNLMQSFTALPVLFKRFWNFRFGSGGLALVLLSAGHFFSELSSLPFFSSTTIEKSSYIRYGILRKTKEFASETAWHIVIVEIWLPMGYSPRWKIKLKKIKIKN